MAGDAPCIITAFVRDFLIAQYHFQHTIDSSGAILATSDTFHRVVLPRVIPYVYSDILKMHAGSATGCNAKVNFLVNMN